MGIRSPDTDNDSGSRFFANTHKKLFLESKYKIQGEEDLSEEDVNEEDIL